MCCVFVVNLSVLCQACLKAACSYSHYTWAAAAEPNADRPGTCSLTFVRSRFSALLFPNSFVFELPKSEKKQFERSTKEVNTKEVNDTVLVGRRLNNGDNRRKQNDLKKSSISNHFCDLSSFISAGVLKMVFLFLRNSLLMSTAWRLSAWVLW